MYIPKINAFDDIDKIVAFIRRFSFATIITAKDGLPVATHLPFLIGQVGEQLVLRSHFAKANAHWNDIEDSKVLVIFSEPHAYISPTHYDHLQNVPTWNYISVHAYGEGKLITDTDRVFGILGDTIDSYEAAYQQQWNDLPDAYKQKMAKGIVAFEINVTDLQAKQKLSQNRTQTEQDKIIDSLSQSDDSAAQLIAGYMKSNQPNR